MAICEICKVEAVPDHDQSLRHVLSQYLSEGKFRTARPDGLIVKYFAALAYVSENREKRDTPGD